MGDGTQLWVEDELASLCAYLSRVLAEQPIDRFELGRVLDAVERNAEWIEARDLPGIRALMFEVDDLVRAGRADEARDRLARWREPKFDHVQESRAAYEAAMKGKRAHAHP